MMNIPGGVTVPADARGDVHGDLPLRDLVAQAISALTFEGTHVVTPDLRVVEASEARDSERDNQRVRVQEKYGALAQPSPDYVQRELLFLYRGEATSVDTAKESNGRIPSVIDTAAEDAVRILKKEMKQKIHEWEGSFKAAHGREAGPSDKSTLRPVYEVYKVAKNRITPGGDGVPPVAPTTAAAGSQPSTSFRPTHHQPTQPSQPAPGAPSRPTTGLAATTSVHSSPPSMPVASTPAPSSAPSAPAAPAAASTALNSAAAPPSSSTLPLGRRLSLEEAAIEKRRLKRRLHQFESDFERRNGRAPQREDRREFSSEYTRYAELKAMLNER